MQAPQHLAKAVLLMVTNNIGSIAMLHARAAGVAHIMFTGSFLHDNKVRFESFVIHSFIPSNRIRYGFMEPPTVSTVWHIIEVPIFDLDSGHSRESDHGLKPEQDHRSNGVLSFNSASQNSVNQITFFSTASCFHNLPPLVRMWDYFSFMASVNWLLLLFAVGNAAVDSGNELLVKGKHQGVFLPKLLPSFHWFHSTSAFIWDRAHPDILLF